MTKKKLKIGAILVALLAVAACTATYVSHRENGEYRSVTKDLNTELTGDIRVHAEKNSPFFAIIPDNPSNALNLFVSPSCNQCGNLAVDVLRAIFQGDEKFRDTVTTFTLIPRQEEDFRIIAGMMCIPPEKFSAAVLSYYEFIQSENGRAPITNQIMERNYLKTMDKFDISENDRVVCEQNDVYLKSIAVYTQFAIELRDRDEVPVVIYNDTYYPEHRFSAIKQIMR